MRATSVRAAAFAAACAAAALWLAPAGAYPPPPGPAASPSASPRAEPNPTAYLGFGSALDFVLDEPVDSKRSVAGSTVRVHLAKRLVVGGVEIAPERALATLKIVSTRAAQAPDVDGSVELELDALPLPGRGSLPLTLAKAFLTVESTAGHQSTRDVLDAAEDVLIPGHVLFRALRKGRELSLPRGTIIRARTAASVDASHAPAVVIATPPPFQLNHDDPHSAFTPIPLYTVPTPPPRPTAQPTPAPH